MNPGNFRLWKWWILVFGIRNTDQVIRNPESTARNPESTTGLDSLEVVARFLGASKLGQAELIYFVNVAVVFKSTNLLLTQMRCEVQILSGQKMSCTCA